MSVLFTAFMYIIVRDIKSRVSGYERTVCACSSAFTSSKLEKKGQLFKMLWGFWCWGLAIFLHAALPSNIP